MGLFKQNASNGWIIIKYKQDSLKITPRLHKARRLVWRRQTRIQETLLFLSVAYNNSLRYNDTQCYIQFRRLPELVAPCNLSMTDLYFCTVNRLLSFGVLPTVCMLFIYLFISHSWHLRSSRFASTMLYCLRMLYVDIMCYEYDVSL